MGGNSVNTFGGASKQAPNVRAHKTTPSKNPAKSCRQWKVRSTTELPRRKVASGGQKQSASTAAPVATVPQPIVSVCSKRSKDTPVADTPARAVEPEVEDTTIATVTTNRSARNAKNDHLQIQSGSHSRGSCSSSAGESQEICQRFSKTLLSVVFWTPTICLRVPPSERRSSRSWSRRWLSAMSKPGARTSLRRRARTRKMVDTCSARSTKLGQGTWR